MVTTGNQRSHCVSLRLLTRHRRAALTYFVGKFFARYSDRQGYAGGDVLGERGADGHAVDDVVEAVSEQHQQGQRGNRTLLVLETKNWKKNIRRANKKKNVKKIRLSFTHSPRANFAWKICHVDYAIPRLSSIRYYKYSTRTVDLLISVWLWPCGNCFISVELPLVSCRDGDSSSIIYKPHNNNVKSSLALASRTTNGYNGYYRREQTGAPFSPRVCTARRRPTYPGWIIPTGLTTWSGPCTCSRETTPVFWTPGT